jgi:hypothetical protein
MNIEFIAASKDAEIFVPHPKPAKLYAPKWYKDIKQDKGINTDLNGDAVDSGALKRCMPFLDGLTSGYIQETWTDIHIKRENGLINYTYPLGPEIINIRDSVSIDISDIYYPLEFIWKIMWFPKLPKGWSMLFTSPTNRLDLPFTSLTGVMDSDHFNHASPNGGNYPFYVHRDFEGIIPAGTPMYQMIPIKRERWESSALDFNLDESLRKMSEIKKFIYNGYKNKFWQKKEYY